MLGFISALSAAVATMTLLMAVLLANVLASAMEVEKNKDKALLTGIKEKIRMKLRNSIIKISWPSH